jgi:hypothetical protein
LDWLPHDIVAHVQATPFRDILRVWREILGDLGPEAQRGLARADRFYLLTVLLRRADALHPWLYDRCREVEAEPDGCLDLWAREHYKSTIITFTGIIQEILRDPEITIGIFSHTKPVARKFLVQVKEELERNEDLQEAFPDILYREPKRESPRWAEDKGIVVRRAGNPKEATVEAHGLVDGQPTGAHFRLRVYDDVVTRESVTTPEQVRKTTDAWGLSDNLGARGPDGKARCWHIGTRYSFRDTYQDILDRHVLKPRVYPATDTGLITGRPVFLAAEVWAEKVRTQGEENIAAQMLQNPAAGTQAMFRKEWLRFLDIRPRTLNVYIMCDPASSKKAGSDNTAVPVVGIDAAGNRYLLDGFHHKMALAERWEAIKGLRRKWLRMPGVQMVKVGYERYGMTSDLEYFEERMRAERDPFELIELAYPREGGGAKKDRIQRLQPYFKQGQFFLPALNLDQTGRMVDTKAQAALRDEGEAYRIFTPVRRKDHTGAVYSLSKNFLDEYLVYPFAAHDDFLDAVSRIQDMEPTAPVIVDQRSLTPKVFADGV